MAGPEEVHPFGNGCMHLRARYKQGRAHRSPFPELRFVRFECDLGKTLHDNEDAQKCQAIKIPCWQDNPELREAAEKAIAASKEEQTD